MARCKSFETSASIRVSPTGAITKVNGAGSVEMRVIGSAVERRARREAHYRFLEQRHALAQADAR